MSSLAFVGLSFRRGDHLGEVDFQRSCDAQESVKGGVAKLTLQVAHHLLGDTRLFRHPAHRQPLALALLP